MPLAPVDNNNTVLFYEDSGRPSGEGSYTTLVLIHGITYNNEIFKKLVPLAIPPRLRLIRVNQRDYPPSSLFTTTELEEFRSTDKEVQARGLRQRGIEIANLLVHLIDTLELPPIAEDKTSGGVSVLGWSMGAHLPIALLGSAPDLSQHVQDHLRPYIRSTILFDPSMFPVGGSIPPIVFTPNRPKGLYWPYFDMEVSLEERLQRFGPWVSSYYDPIEDISSVTLDQLGERQVIQDLPDDRLYELGVDSWKKQTSLERIPNEKLLSMSSDESAARYPGSLGKVDPEVYRGCLRRALGLDDSLFGSFTSPLVWPDCKIVLVWCDMTLVDCTIASTTLVKLVADEGSKIQRKLEVEKLTRANHFPHWDEPGKVVSLLTKCI